MIPNNPKWLPSYMFSESLPKFMYLARVYGPVKASVMLYDTADAQILAILIYRRKQYPEVSQMIRRRNYKELTSYEKYVIVEMYRRGFSIYAIAKRLNRPPSTVYYFLRRVGLK